MTVPQIRVPESERPPEMDRRLLLVGCAIAWLVLLVSGLILVL